MRKPRAAAGMGLLFGFISLMNFSRNPGFASVSALGVVELIGAGMCFGCAIAGIATLLRKRDSL